MSVRRWAAVTAAIALTATACGTEDLPPLDVGAEAPADDAVDDDAATDDGADEPADAAEVALASTEFGEVLVDGDGRALYLFEPDDAGESTCYDECAATWPPVTGPATAGSGVDATLLGTTTRTDGSVQVTYAGWPLYLFAGDDSPGDVNGQGVNDVWWVVDADGEAVVEAEAPDSFGY